jgi:hypothetical protein
MQIATFNGATSYSTQISSPMARLMFLATYTTNISELNAAKVTLTKSGISGGETILPELNFAQICDMAGSIDALVYVDATAKTVAVSLPISMGGSYFVNGNDWNLQLSGCTTTNTFKIFAIEDDSHESDYISVKQVGCLANAEKTYTTGSAVMLFINPTQITRIKLMYKNRTVELTSEEVAELARVSNPVQRVTLAGALTAGYDVLAPLNIKGTEQIALTMNTNCNPLVLEHIL